METLYQTQNQLAMSGEVPILYLVITHSIPKQYGTRLLNISPQVQPHLRSVTCSFFLGLSSCNAFFAGLSSWGVDCKFSKCGVEWAPLLYQVETLCSTQNQLTMSGEVRTLH